MKKTAGILNLIAVAFTALFFIYSQTIGGDAFTGMDAPEHASNFISGAYYVANHGVYTQVSQTVWIWSCIITATFGVSLVAALVVNIIAMFRKTSAKA